MSAATTIIRAARADDVSAILAVLAETWHATYDAIYGVDEVSRITRAWHTPERIASEILGTDGVSLVGERNGAVVAHARASTDGRVIDIHRLYVHPSAQGQGIGARLLREALAFDQRATLAMLDVEHANTRALAFYRRHGFDAVPDGRDDPVRWYPMEKVLDPARLAVRRAREADLPRILDIYATDIVGGHRQARSAEDVAAVEAAFRRIAASGANTLYVAEQGGVVLGTFQLTIIPGLVAAGRTRAKVESVHVHAEARGRGIGAEMMRVAEVEARRKGAGIMELMSNVDRRDAHRFYERLRFAKSHAGFKKVL